jgi:nucleotide-binding universal stress UspA family protein
LLTTALILLPAICFGVGRVGGGNIDSLPALADSTYFAAVAPKLTFGGLLAAVVFTGSLVTVLAWLLAVPKPVPAVAAHARRIISSIRRIVVPLEAQTNWERAVELACRLGEDQKAEVVLTSVVEVPFTLSLNAPMMRAEREANDLIERALTIVNNHELPARTKVERARQMGEGIARLARDEDADLIVMAAPRPRRGLPGAAGRTLDTLLHRAPCEVIIYSLPDKAEEPGFGQASPESTPDDSPQTGT